MSTHNKENGAVTGPFKPLVSNSKICSHLMFLGIYKELNPDQIIVELYMW